MTCRDEILAAFERLENRHGRRDFALAEVVLEVQAGGSDCTESTIRTHVTSVMCRDSPVNHGTVYDDLRRIGRGQYERKR